MSRLVLIFTLAALAFPLPALALQQQQPGGRPFGPLPPAAPEPTATPTPEPSVEVQQDTDRRLLYAIGGALLVLFIVIGRVITRDARTTLRHQGRDIQKTKLREEGPHRHARESKAKARAKTKAQRRARRQNR